MILKDPKDLLQWFDGYMGCPNDECFSLADIHQAINGTPTIEAEPVRHGRWERIDYDESYCECSKCKTTWEWGFVQHCKMNYCPNCGAKMDFEGE